MFVITGASGQTGTAAMLRLLERGQTVRAVVRREEQAAAWRTRGAEAVVADLADAAAMTAAFAGAAGVYVMNPPAYKAPDILAHARAVHRSMVDAAEQAEVRHIVGLSSVGAQHAEGTGNILTTHDLEMQVSRSSIPSTLLRAANFIENWAWAIDGTRTSGELPSMLLPTSRRIPMVAAADIGRVAADLLIEGPGATDLVELHGPDDYSPDDAAVVFSELFCRPVSALPIPETEWPKVFRGSGFSETTVNAFCEMYSGFNSGLIAFEGTGVTNRGAIGLSDALTALVQRPGVAIRARGA